MRSKGSAAERELLTMLWGCNFAAIRAAGSGVQKFYCPDVLASNGNRVIAIECKSTKHKYQYFEPEQIRQLLEFAKMFKAEAWLAVKFSTNWKFFRPEDLKPTGKALVVTAKDNAKLFSDITCA
ncbi:MAG: Holliday junction resolvase Hjc [Candidatus Nanoarchaeia archaeon]